MLTPQQLQDNLDLLQDFEEETEPTKAYLFSRDLEKVTNVDDEVYALQQAILLYTSIERYDHMIYTWDNFIELKDLFGKPTSYVVSEIPRRFRECLLQDDRILAVNSFQFEVNKNVVAFSYVVESIYGDIEQQREVIF